MKKIKKIYFILSSVGVLLFGGNLAHASSTDHPRVYVDGTILDIDAIVTPICSTLVPFRSIFEKYDMDVAWDNKTKTVTAKKEDVVIKLTENSIDAFVNDKKVKLIQAPTVTGNDS